MRASAGIARTAMGKHPGSRFVLAYVLVLACGPFLAVQTVVGLASEIVSASTPSAASSPALPECIISPDDVLTINVYAAPDVTGQYRVSPTGQIEIPLLSTPIVAFGRTPAQLAELISEKYRQAEIYTHPRVTVAIKESAPMPSP